MERSRLNATAYDQLAPYYREYAEQKSAYLDAVDRFIVNHTITPAVSVLDVGAGDGVRGMALARRLGARRIVLCEPSAELARRCESLAAGEVWRADAEQLPLDAGRFDVILCLWNVLGHLPDRTARVSALTRMRTLLNPAGALFFDVNNRHNARAYGWLRVLTRRILDVSMPDERRGDAAFNWRIAGREILTRGHLFTPAEVANLLNAAGLRVARRIAVDYGSGAYSEVPWHGQLLYQAAA